MGMTKDVFDEYGNYKYPDYSNSQYTNYATATGGKMGMTIDDNVDFLNEAKDLFEDVANDPKIKETIKTYCIIDSLEIAIETMRKYQKIEEIVKRYGELDKEETDKFYWDVIGVVEDGSN